MREDPHDTEVASYVAGRWPVVVRTLVLLGAPPPHAERLATGVAASFLHRWSLDRSLDLDAELVAEAVHTWELDRTTWWRRPAAHDDELEGTGVPELLVAFDALTPLARARTVARAVAGLDAGQVDDVLGPAEPSPRTDALAVEAARLAPLVPVGDPHVDVARSRADGHRRRSRGLTVGGSVVGLVLLAVAVGLGVRAADPRPDPAAAPASTSPTVASDPSRQPLSDDDGLSGRDLDPVAWYDGRRVHLAGHLVPVPRLVALVRVADGVVATDQEGRVLHVKAGGVETLGRTTPGTAVVADPRTSDAAWVDATTGDVVVRRLTRTGGDGVTVPARSARVVAIDDRRVYVDSPGGQPLTQVGDYVLLQAPDRMFDASAGTQASQLDRGRVLVTAGHQAGDVAGREGLLSDDGHYLLTHDLRASGAPPRVVVDLGSGDELHLNIGAGVMVRDGAFGDGTVTFVVEDRNGIQSPPDRPTGRSYVPGFLLVVCDVRRVACQPDVEVYGADAQPLLAR